VDGALSLSRKTEYCQWQQLSQQRCNTCTRTVRAKDGSTSSESYSCDCVTHYSYIKSWFSYRINSLLFDQPAAHYNPQRDPYPSSQIVASSGALFGVKGSEVSAVVGPELLANVRAPFRHIDWTFGSHANRHSWWSGWWGKDRSIYEPISNLGATVSAPAAIRDHFSYVGQGGYFFSPYEVSRSEFLLRAFGQYLEGSILDWQIGDLMPSCTAGDIRVSYSAQAPKSISVIAEAASAPVVRDGGRLVVPLRAHPTSVGLPVGLVHGGRATPDAMLNSEVSDSSRRSLLPRFIVALWALAASRLLGVAITGSDLASDFRRSWFPMALSLWLFMLGLIWTYLWDPIDVVSSVFLILALSISKWASGNTPPAFVRPGLRAAWCMLARWANLSPEWRIEDGYVGVPVSSFDEPHAQGQGEPRGNDDGASWRSIDEQKLMSKGSSSYPVATPVNSWTSHEAWR